MTASLRFTVNTVVLMLITVAGACASATKDSVHPTPAATASLPAAGSELISPTAATAPKPQGTLYGVSLSPRSFTGDDFTKFLDMAKRAGGLLRGGDQWLKLNEKGGSANVVAQLAPQHGMKAVIETSFFLQHSGELTTDITDHAVRAELVRIASEFASANKPPFMGLGVEINILEEHNPAAFDAFADDLFPAAAKAIREVSPQTKVFTTFQLERLRGLRGGLFGGTNDLTSADWDLLKRFPDADFISFTTYPGLIFQSVEEVPADYYLAIKQYTDGPIAFTELSWMVNEGLPGWEADASEQAAFVRKFFETATPVTPLLVVWLHLFDQPASPAPFQAGGLFDNSGNERLAWREWLASQ